MKRWMAFYLCMSAASLIADDGSTAPAPARWDFQLPESIEMPGGEIYNHPKVVDVKPNGITIMHDDGAAFWLFSQLPEAIWNKFHYNPAAAREYTDELILRREKLDEMKAKRKIADARHQVYADMVSQRYYCTYLEMKIAACGRQIKADKDNVANASSNIQNDRKNIAADAVASTGNNNGGNGFFWNSNGNEDNSARMHVIGEFDSDWKNSKTDYEMWNFAEQGAANNLAEYQQQYKDAQAKLKDLTAKWNQVQQQEKLDSKQVSKQIHDSIQQTVQDSITELKKLTQMRNQKLITQEEYIRKKAEILKRF